MGNQLTCSVCRKSFPSLGCSLNVCPECVRGGSELSRDMVGAIHLNSRKAFGLPLHPPRTPGGLHCRLCSNECRMAQGELGYCGVRSGSRESFRHDGRSRAKVSFYFDPLPTNCVADWVCPGGTGAGFPRFAHDAGAEVGFFNLAVFFEACNFNCLYCQNWSFKVQDASQTLWRPPEYLTRAVTDDTSCICYFGGDPTPQVPFALKASARIRAERPKQILRFCWETNGSVHPAYLKQMARLSLETGGCVKMDLKAWSPQVHRALCGVDNARVLENFKRVAEWVPLRPESPLLVASTLLVPGYVGEEEVGRIASFIAGLNPDIPYALLVFTPQFCMEDFSTTSRQQAEACLEAAKRAGLRRVRLGNRHFMS